MFASLTTRVFIDLRDGQQQTWFHADYVRHPLWGPAGDRFAVSVRDSTRWAILAAEPGAGQTADTLLASDAVDDLLDVVDFHAADDLLLQQWDKTGRRDRRASGRPGGGEEDDDWEYPWWVLLPGREIVALRSTLPSLPPPAADSVRVIVCTAADKVCRAVVPAGWRYERHGVVGVGTPA